MRQCIRYLCKLCKYKWIAPIALKCPICHSTNIQELEKYNENAPLQ